jgi:hypothetical protein
LGGIRGCATSETDIFKLFPTVQEDYCAWFVAPVLVAKVIIKHIDESCILGYGKLRMLATCFMLVSCMAYSSTLQKGAAFSSEMSVDFHRTTWYNIIND